MNSDSKSKSKLAILLGRLRDLEAECLRISNLDLPTERSPIRQTYEDRLQQLEASHSRSWFGDHSATYYLDFKSPPAGRSFDVEWGFIPGFRGSHNPNWRIYSRNEIREFVFREIGEDIFYELHALSEQITSALATARDQTLDVMELLSTVLSSSGLERYRRQIQDELSPYTIADYVNGQAKSAPRMTRDSEELAKGSVVPAHVQYLSAIQSVDVTKRRGRELATVLRNVLQVAMLYESEDNVVTGSHRIFIGHGRSDQWRILKDFLGDRLGLHYDEFNRVSTAGLNTQERLSEMLRHCGFAFLVLTAEDLHADGGAHARENVIHEAGLFQGRLGWRRAILLLEEGCAEFSNIVGLGQIRFPRGDIAARFEEIRLVLEREGMLSP